MTETGNEITGKEISEEDLLDFKLDDLSLDDLDSGDSGAEDSEEDILELVDLVEEGDRDTISATLDEDIAKLLEEEGDAEMLEKEDFEIPVEEVSAQQKTPDAEDVLSTAEISIDFSDTAGCRDFGHVLFHCILAAHLQWHISLRCRGFFFFLLLAIHLLSSFVLAHFLQQSSL